MLRQRWVRVVRVVPDAEGRPVLPVGRGAVARAAHQLVHERDVRDGQTQRLDARETLLVRERGNLNILTH